MLGRYLYSLAAACGVLGAALSLGLLTAAQAGYVGMPLWAGGGIQLGAKSTSLATTILTPSRVQGCNFSDSTGTGLSTWTCVMPAGVLAGDTVNFLTGYGGNGLDDITSVVDDKGDVCTKLDFATLSFGYSQNTLTCPNLTAGATTFTFTVTNTPSFDYVVGDEFSNVGPVDVHQMQFQANTSGTNGLSSGNVTTTFSGEEIWGAALSGAITSPGTGFTQGSVTPTTNVMSEFTQQASSGVIAATFTPSGTQSDSVAAIVAFQPVVSTTTLSVTLQNIKSRSSLLLGVSWCYSGPTNICGPTTGTGVLSVADNNGNAWSQKSIATGTQAVISVWGASHVTNAVSPNDVITVTWTGPIYGLATSLYASEWRNALGVFEIENVASLANTASISVTTSGATSRNKEIVYGFGRGFNGCIAPGQTAVNGPVARPNGDPGVTDEYQVGSLAGSFYSNSFAQCGTNIMSAIVLGLY